jgi:hypothetical protein
MITDIDTNIKILTDILSQQKNACVIKELTNFINKVDNKLIYIKKLN